MTASVIVPHFGDPALTVACVKSVQERDDVELIVVDNQGNMPLLGAVWTLTPPDNLGFARGCNYGAKVASGDVLIFLNNDCVVHDGWLDPLLTAVVLGGGIAGAKLVYEDGRIQHAGIGIDFTRAPGEEAWNLQDNWCDRPHPVDAVTGACLAIDRNTFQRLDGFNEAYWNGYEDVDLCLAARRKGIPVSYVPQSVVTHLESRSNPYERFRCAQQNIQLLRATWGDR